MKKNLFVTVLVSILLLGCLQLAWAGVEPSPFCVRIVKLENVALSLGGNNRMLALLLSYDPVRSEGPADICYPPPDPVIVCQPGGPVSDDCVITFNALAEEIRGLAKDVQRLEEAVYDVTKHPPEPGVPVDRVILQKLEAVRNAAMALIDQINDVPPPDDGMVQNALAKLKRNAQSMINTIDAFSPPLVE